MINVIATNYKQMSGSNIRIETERERERELGKTLFFCYIQNGAILLDSMTQEINISK